MPNAVNKTPPTQDDRKESKNEWAKRKGLTEYKGSSYLGINFLTRTQNLWNERNFPAADHISYWNKNGKPYCIVSQPYHLDDDEMAQAAAVCKAHHLEVSVSTWPAWLYPGSVLFMVWKRTTDVEDGL